MWAPSERAGEPVYTVVMRRAALAALAALLLAAACSGSKPTASRTAVQVQRTEVHGSEERTTAPVVAHAARPRVLAEVQFRDHVLVIRSGSGEHRYDVHARGGAILASSLTRTELDRRFPEIADHFRDSTAIQLDATLETQAGPAALDR
jgi:hypothetical protein